MLLHTIVYSPYVKQVRKMPHCLGGVRSDDNRLAYSFETSTTDQTVPMMTIRRSAFLSLVVGGVALLILSGCSAGNPHINSAEDAMEQQEYDRALANIDSALAQDSANVDAYTMRAQILRNKADSTMAPADYKDLYRRARAAEEKAIKFDPGARSEVEGQRTLTFAQESQRGARAFQRGRQSSDTTAYRQAAAHFGAASATYPDSASVILNEAFALLNMEQNKQNGTMTNAIPMLERYLERADQPDKNAYDILSALYLQDGQVQNAIETLETAIDDLSQRDPYIQVGGSRGLKYTGEVSVNGSSRSVDGTTPDRVSLDAEGEVSATFEKTQEKGQLQVSLYYKGSAIKDTLIQSGSATLSANLGEETPLARLEGRLLNAYNRAGDTEKALQAYREQIDRNPENATYRYNYGSLLLQQERYEDAVEELSKAVELDPGNAKAQYNLGAAYTNMARSVQDSLSTLNDSIRSISRAAMEENREPTQEEEQQVNELDAASQKLEKEKRGLFRQAIPPLERARQLSDSGTTLEKNICNALLQAYVQIEQTAKAKSLESCAGLEVQQGGEGSGGGGN